MESWESVLTLRYRAIEQLSKEGRIRQTASWYSDYTEAEQELINQRMRDIKNNNAKDAEES